MLLCSVSPHPDLLVMWDIPRSAQWRFVLPMEDYQQDGVITVTATATATATIVDDTVMSSGNPAVSKPSLIATVTPLMMATTDTAFTDGTHVLPTDNTTISWTRTAMKRNARQHPDRHARRRKEKYFYHLLLSGKRRRTALKDLRSHCMADNWEKCLVRAKCSTCTDMLAFVPHLVEVKVSVVDKDGLGVFALKRLLPGTLILPFTGQQYSSLRERTSAKRCYAICVSRGHYIVPPNACQHRI
jgi:hypothetical protein